MDIREALEKLDIGVDDHWTADGAPKIDVVAKLTKIKDLKRADITDVAPKFTRTNPVFDEDTPPEETPVVEAEEDTTEADIEQAELLVTERLAELDEKNKALARAKDERAVAEFEYNEAVNILNSVRPANNSQATIQAYLKSQADQRNKRYEDQLAARKAFGKFAPDTRAPIDKVHTGKPAIGSVKKES